MKAGFGGIHQCVKMWSSRSYHRQKQSSVMKSYAFSKHMEEILFQHKIKEVNVLFQVRNCRSLWFIGEHEQATLTCSLFLHVIKAGCIQNIHHGDQLYFQSYIISLYSWLGKKSEYWKLYWHINADLAMAKKTWVCPSLSAAWSIEWDGILSFQLP